MGRARVRVPHEQGLTCTNALTCLHLVYTEHTPVAHVQFYGGLTADRCCCWVRVWVLTALTSWAQSPQ